MFVLSGRDIGTPWKAWLETVVPKQPLRSLPLCDLCYFNCSNLATSGPVNCDGECSKLHRFHCSINQWWMVLYRVLGGFITMKRRHKTRRWEQLVFFWGLRLVLPKMTSYPEDLSVLYCAETRHGSQATVSPRVQTTDSVSSTKTKKKSNLS